MQANVGGLERAVQIVVELAVLNLGSMLEGNARRFGVIGAVPLLTRLGDSFPACRQLGPITRLMGGRP